MIGTMLQRDRPGTGLRRPRGRAGMWPLAVLCLAGVSGCGPLGMLLNQFAGPPPSPGQVELRVWFIGVDQNVFDAMKLDLNETLTVESAESEALGAATPRDSTLLVPSNLSGGAENTQELIARDARVGTYLPVAVPVAAMKGAAGPAKPARANQVRIAVRLAEVTLSTVDQLGVDFGVAVPFGVDISPAAIEPSGAPELHALLGSILDDAQAGALLRALQSDASSEILASPKILLFDNQSAAVIAENEAGLVKDLEPTFAQAVEAFDPQAQIIQTGMVLDIRPVISTDRQSITLELRPGMRAVLADSTQQITGVGDQGLAIRFPVVQPSSVRTTVTVPDGGTVVLGGQMTTPDRRESGVPVLGQVPLLNRLFRADAPIQDEQVLLVFVTPRIIQHE